MILFSHTILKAYNRGPDTKKEHLEWIVTKKMSNDVDKDFDFTASFYAL